MTIPASSSPQFKGEVNSSLDTFVLDSRYSNVVISAYQAKQRQFVFMFGGAFDRCVDALIAVSRREDLDAICDGRPHNDPPHVRQDAVVKTVLDFINQYETFRVVQNDAR